MCSFNIALAEQFQFEIQQPNANLYSNGANHPSENYRKGQAFLMANAKKQGVVTTRSGLQYKILRKGKGQYPKSYNQVKVFYQGKTLDNKVFDSNINQKPITFGLNQVIKGWTEGLTKVSEGGRIELYIPSDLAYGAKGAPPAIGQHETLIFVIDLIKVY
ncbi:peptidylprolyl isomerase [Saccharobesus litoralis]|uniref:Peptidyl-prolyl cis-trans isomerase n=2 Tax=Saccharobesus litoralis TaxID=2172099 RepID=A0A2S0VXW9_9ALTE|nr:peptidylprolyl isomerase [Saccharobesus litoralis]